MPKRPGKLQFISWTHGDGGDVADTQRRAHSHAARTAHARERRLRILEYQARKAAQGIVEDWGTRDSAPAEPMKNVAAAPDGDVFSLEEETSMPSPPLIGLLDSGGRGDPFSSFASPFNPIEHFLLYHYVTVVIPFMSSLCITLREHARYSEERSRDWVQLVLSDPGSTKGIFLAASRHLSKIHQQRQNFLRLSLQYKIDCIQALRRAISAGTLTAMDDSTFAKIIILAADEFLLGNLEMSRHHIRGAVKVVELKGGPHTLGLGGFLEHILYKYVGEVGLSYKFQPPEIPSF
ncbi:uncharacterized protein Z520_04332 [Fonsecaea multimorphosa CBS 102226]|uniref:Uncharacterized protein n=1 Tax=Fonsecaea multimorphosa CBS 102226 TaxID=1442371 RepID=A0A0D2K1G6_9EURO|nr:uncharacterized protein Z520_04332 [Fonsecaea multimorphosa CBS 102226]KIX99697.1 hypothetical protein Z520_04332 [Fonsecaea multimorphosa CBS 102226]OAL26747.1 hypothetical protein AYO22_04100 [Fonsecaea multimorphosa]